MADAPKDDDLASQLLEGDSYEQATVNVRRMVPLSLDGKLYLAIGSIALSVLTAPVVLFRQDLIRSLEETGSLDLTLGVLVLNGVLTAFLAGLALVRQQHITRGRNLDPADAQKLVRIEDFLSMFVIIGAMFIIVPMTLLLVGVVSPSLTETLYGHGVNIYSKTTVVGIDARTVSIFGAVCAVSLLAVWQLYARRPD